MQESAAWRGCSLYQRVQHVAKLQEQEQVQGKVRRSPLVLAQVLEQVLEQVREQVRELRARYQGSSRA